MNAISSDPMIAALEQARLALSQGDLPVGAVLEVSGNIVGTAHNRIISQKSLLAHAENALLVSHSRLLFNAQQQSHQAVLYTTLEPCLMCLSAAVHARVKKIVYACRDPHGGAGEFAPPRGWYETNWPTLEHDPANMQASLALIRQFCSVRPIWAERYAELIRE